MMIQRAHSHGLSILAVSVLLVAGSGCKRKDTERTNVPPTPGAPGTTPPTTTPQQPETADAGMAGAGTADAGMADAGDAQQDVDLSVLTITGVDIDTKLAELCGVPATAVFFKYDSANLSAEAKGHLDQLATCAKTGAAKGKNLLVVGWTDPTGTDEYNKQLGMSRATSVSNYLRSKGVQKQRIQNESVGEGAAMDARWSWPWSRRVTIRLAE